MTLVSRPFLSEFTERRRDVRRYLAVLVRAERALGTDRDRIKHDRELRIFRAGALLVLYNAIEASARSGIQAIYDEIEETQTPFDDLRDGIRKRVVRDFKANFGVDSYRELRQIALHLVSASFDPEKLFSGNVDAREIRNKSSEYGFDVSSLYERTKHGEDLLTIKTRRNDLAHGVVSFSEVGRDYLAADIRRIARYSMNYMHDVLLHIDRYLSAGAYKSEVII